MTFPSWLIAHPDLKDFDIRMLLLLDQKGWREGARDGVVRETAESLGEILGKSPSTVRESILRIERIRPRLISRDQLHAKKTDTISLVYDRFGGASVTPPDADRPDDDDRADSRAETEKLVSPTLDLEGETEISVSHVSSCPDPTEIVPVVAVEAASNDSVEFEPETEKLVSLPIWKEELLVPLVRGGSDCEGKAEISVTGSNSEQPSNSEDIGGRLPKTLPALLDWLPAITDDALELKRLRRKVPLWLARLNTRCPDHAASTIEWIQDALIKATDKDDLVRYAEGTLQSYAALGGRPKFEVAPERILTPPDATDTGTPVIYATPADRPRLGASTAPRTSYTDRLNADRQKFRDGFAAMKVRKEVEHGDGA